MRSKLGISMECRRRSSSSENERSVLRVCSAREVLGMCPLKRRMRFASCGLVLIGYVVRVVAGDDRRAVPCFILEWFGLPVFVTWRLGRCSGSDERMVLRKIGILSRDVFLN